MCKTSSHGHHDHRHAGVCRCGCPCCGGGSGIKRRYPTSQEIREKLEEYRDELKKELQGVEEEIKRTG